MDHDQRFKALIREFFADFLQLFFADWASLFDLSTIEWLDKEVLPDPPQGSRHQLDLVARLWTRERVSDSQPEAADAWLALVHIEIESPETTTRLKPRLPSYYVHLRDQHGRPVLPIVLYLNVALDGIGVDTYEERFGNLTPLRFQYLYIGLPGLNGVEYAQGQSWLGVALAALMRIPKDQAVWFVAEALRRLVAAPLNDQQRFLLVDCVEAYLSLDDEQLREYQRVLQTSSDQGVHAMNKTTYDRGLEAGLGMGLMQGREKGREEGARSILLRIATREFGAPTPELLTQIQTIHDLERLEALADRVFEVTSWDELMRR
jgi:hypothetical protein